MKVSGAQTSAKASVHQARVKTVSDCQAQARKVSGPRPPAHKDRPSTTRDQATVRASCIPPSGKGTLFSLASRPQDWGKVCAFHPVSDPLGRAKGEVSDLQDQVRAKG